jgi:hypothetical protein
MAKQGKVSGIEVVVAGRADAAVDAFAHALPGQSQETANKWTALRFSA